MERIKPADGNEFKFEIGYRDYVYLYAAYAGIKAIADLCRADKTDAALVKEIKKYLYSNCWLEKGEA